MAKIALLIGVSDYEPGLNALPGAVKDVDAMQQVLKRNDIGEFADSDITVLKSPDRQKMEEEIEKLFAGRQKDDLILLYFSGHGVKDDTGRLYLATRYTRKTPRGELIRSSAVAAGFIHENMDRSRSKRQVVILDSCFSGAFAEGLSAKDDGSVNIAAQLGGEGRAVLTSSTSTQYSFEQQDADLSVYTRFLIDGMATGAADSNGDGFVSIGELHEYASQKVREIQPAMKPEIYPGKEGYTIRLTKTPPVDPREQYAQEVRRYVTRGDVSFVGRKILDALKTRTRLSDTEAKAIEDDILAEARQDFRERLLRYECDFTEALQQDTPLSGVELKTLTENLQQILVLRNEDTQAIEDNVRAKIATYQQHLSEYRQALSRAMNGENPLSEKSRRQLQKMRREWELADKDVSRIEKQVTVEIAEYQKRLRQYEQTLADTLQQYNPLNDSQRQALLQEQHQLGLNPADVEGIENRIIGEFAAYGQKLQDYEQTMRETVRRESPLSDESWEELNRYQRVLELKDEDAASIKVRIISEHIATPDDDIETLSEENQGLEPDAVTEPDTSEMHASGSSTEVVPEEGDLGTTQEMDSPENLRLYQQELLAIVQAGETLDANHVRYRLTKLQQTLALSDSAIAGIQAKVKPQTADCEVQPPSDIVDGHKRPKSVSSKHRRRWMLFGNGLMGLILTFVAQCSFTLFTIGAALLLTVSGYEIFFGEPEALPVWRRWTMRLGLFLSIPWLITMINLYYTNRIGWNGELACFDSSIYSLVGFIPYLIFVFIGRW